MGLKLPKSLFRVLFPGSKKKKKSRTDNSKGSSSSKRPSHGGAAGGSSASNGGVGYERLSNSPDRNLNKIDGRDESHWSRPHTRTASTSRSRSPPPGHDGDIMDKHDVRAAEEAAKIEITSHGSAFDRPRAARKGGGHVGCGDDGAAANNGNNNFGRFSSRGEEARRRAVARQRRILSRASMRLDAISDTSLSTIDEASRLASDIDMAGLRRRRMMDNFAGVGSTGGGGGGSRADKARGGIGPDGGGGGDDAANNGSVPYKPQTEGMSLSSMIFYESPTSLLRTPSASPSTIVEEDAGGENGASNDNSQGGEKQGGRSPAAQAALITPEKGQEERHLDQWLAQDDTGNVDDDDAAVADGRDLVQFFVLLLCPSSRIFELVELESPRVSVSRQGEDTYVTIEDVIALIPDKCTDDRLLEKKFVGFVRPFDRAEFMTANARAFAAPDGGAADGKAEGGAEEDAFGGDFIRDNDVLVATLDGYTGYEMSKISKPILRNAKFRSMIGRRSRRNGEAKGLWGVAAAAATWEDKEEASCRSTRSHRSSKSGRSKRSKRSSKQSSSSRSRRGHRRQRRSTTSKKSSGGAPVVDFLPEEIDASSRNSRRRASPSKGGAGGVEGGGGGGNPKYSSLCQKLEHLSKKLHEVDDEILAGDVARAANDEAANVQNNLDDTFVSASEEVHAADLSVSYKMTPRMVAYELAANIEDIFRDHDVEIVAVDAEDDTDSDEETFATARSNRSVKSVRTLIAKFDTAGGKPPRKSRPSKFDSYEDGDMMVQIEAMAREADAAFESRKETPKNGGAVIIEPTATDAGAAASETQMDIHLIEDDGDNNVESENIEEVADSTLAWGVMSALLGSRAPQSVLMGEKKKRSGPVNLWQNEGIDDEDAILSLPCDDSAMDSAVCESESLMDVAAAMDHAAISQLPASFNNEDATVMEVTPDNFLGTVKSLINKEEDGVRERALVTQNKEALSKNFLNTSTSMVSTMVAASEGRVNEVHVLSYLGVTIVCIAANMKKMNPQATFGAKEMLQSAMFLAFMVNGQRYLAKVTKGEDAMKM